MRELLKLRHIRYEIMDQLLVEEVNATVHQGDIIGIIGKNGAGKSTLLQMLNKRIAPTDGQVQWLEENVEMVYVEQETQFHSFEEVEPLEAALLEKMNVPTHDFSKLSGGEKLKARLAKGFAQEAQLLLLDEPTNHLDQSSTELVRDLMKSYNDTIIFVSHDRYFLDEVATKIWSIENKKLIEHKGNYSSYVIEREQRRLTQQREYEKQQKMVERIETQMHELTSWSNKAHSQSTKQEGFKEYHRVKAKRLDSQVKSKRKRLEKELEKAKVERVEPDYQVQFSLKANSKIGKRFLEVKNLSKTFDDTVLFKNVHFTIQHGEKVAIVGPNGSGKTTLLKVIMGQERAEGTVWVSPSAEIGYLTQEVYDLPLEKTPAELFYKETFAERGRVQNLMRHLGFTAEQWTEPIGNMSMGERVKCKLMAFILEEKDVLILDEPTNHLDLPSREQLEQTLSEYKGTLLVVSHDRYFREKTTDIRLIISNGSINKAWKAGSVTIDDKEELRLKLETERQEILGKLSFMTPKDQAYEELDKKFNELTKKIKELK
ncbi:ribosomal protection-like ABC-F family protein [Niallia endozanthoxylica]|uniref:Ribosome protection protein VmlR n=1 Tax=Niallia endozanthoxylica TaxID=2036016 RepID=A0A5J5HP23_9BACI|nr:ABC-F type ribosomal protection protein [Niallia endozanthoxylica]KAA9021578.1 ABC-F type ribosomal protection protein [Niallia endozanthoxylica]